MILLETNVISELVRAEPHPAVVAYVSRLAPQTVFTAAVCEVEIRYGLARMPAGRKRDGLDRADHDFLRHRVPGLDFAVRSALRRPLR